MLYRLISRMSSIEDAAAAAILGSPTTIAKHIAREMATLSRFRSKMNDKPREPYSPKLEHMDRMHTGASWPWNLSTLPTRAPAGKASVKART